MKLKIEITLGNDAMMTAGDVMRAIQESSLARIPSEHKLSPAMALPSGPIRDDNGNKVGAWRLVSR